MAGLQLTVVITTKNEAANIAACIHSFDVARGQGKVEVIVVDNASTDETKKIAAELGAAVFDKGPERSAQRNLGWQKGRAPWAMIIDADMIIPPETVEEILEKTAAGDEEKTAAYWIPEVRTGTGFRVRARNFERSFYNGTCIDALRLFRKEVLEKTGGYDESLIAGPEDWELDIRVLALGVKCEVLEHHLIHNERQLTLKRVLEKKAYYSHSMAAYQAKWPNHPAVKKQFSLYYRYLGVFIEKGKWRKILRHPILFVGVMCERVLVGFVYLKNRKK